MALRLYEVTMNGGVALLRLSEQDAAHYGENARLVEDEVDTTAVEAPAKQRTAANKSRTAQDK